MTKYDDIQKRNDLIVIGISFLFPALSILLLLYMIYQKRQYALYLLAILLAITTLKFLPVMDLYRHTMDYYYFKEQTFADFNSEIRLDFTLYYLSFLCGKLNLPFECVRFIYALTSYTIFFHVYKKMVNLLEISDKKEAFLLFLSFLFVIPVIAVSLGLRFAFASSIMFLSLFKYFIQRKRMSSFILALFSVVSHFSMLPFALLILLAGKLKRITNAGSIFFMSGLFLIIATVIFEFFLNNFVSFELLSTKVETYTGDGMYGGFNPYDAAPWWVKLRALFPLLKLMTVFIVVLCIKHNTMIKNYIVYAWLFILLLYPNISSMIRYSLFLAEASVLCIALYWNSLSINRKYILISILFIACISEIYADRNCILMERFVDLVYIPLPFHFLYQDNLNFMLLNFDHDGYYTHF